MFRCNFLSTMRGRPRQTKGDGDRPAGRSLCLRSLSAEDVCSRKSSAGSTLAAASRFAMASSPPGNTSALAGILPSNASDAAAAAEDPRAAYLDSCRDLAGAIGSLEQALVSFTGKEDGVKGQVFAKTRSRLEKELSESSSMMAAPPAQPRQA